MSLEALKEALWSGWVGMLLVCLLPSFMPQVACSGKSAVPAGTCKSSQVKWSSHGVEWCRVEGVERGLRGG